MPETIETKKPFDLGKIIGFTYLAAVLLALYFGKEFLLPIILAVLISFVLAPLVARLERWRFPPVLAVLVVVAIAFAVIGLLAATVSLQTLDLVSSLPKYRDNINAKWAAVKRAPPGPLNQAFSNVSTLWEDLNKSAKSGATVQSAPPQKVEVVSGEGDLLAIARNSVTPLFGPIAEFAIVVVLVIFMLLERLRLRARFLRLIGHSHRTTTTLAIDEAGSRLSKFLLVQFQVNSGYALVLGAGLYLIGIPNAILWAVLTLALRFLPYIGLWISAFCPVMLSFAISTSWREPILTFALYAGLEVFTNNVVEPVVLGGSTGISALAVIISALFWTWLWGPIGLFLATPLTACLVALGLYFPAFRVYSVLLAADPPTSSETKLIRFLTESRLSEAKALVHELTGMRLSVKTAEELIVPTVRTIEVDLFPTSGFTKSKTRIYEQFREVVAEMTIAPFDPARENGEHPVLGEAETTILPLLGEGDEVIGNVLTRLLKAEGVPSRLIPWRMLFAERMEQLKQNQPKCIVLSAVDPRSATVVGKMARSIQDVLPETVIVIGLWSLPPEGAARLIRKIREFLSGSIYTNLEEAVRGIIALGAPLQSEAPEPKQS